MANLPKGNNWEIGADDIVAQLSLSNKLSSWGLGGPWNRSPVGIDPGGIIKRRSIVRSLIQGSPMRVGELVRLVY
jgi:hypothetical protein